MEFPFYTVLWVQLRNNKRMNLICKASSLYTPYDLWLCCPIDNEICPIDHEICLVDQEIDSIHLISWRLFCNIIDVELLSADTACQSLHVLMTLRNGPLLCDNHLGLTCRLPHHSPSSWRALVDALQACAIIDEREYLKEVYKYVSSSICIRTHKLSNNGCQEQLFLSQYDSLSPCVWCEHAVLGLLSWTKHSCCNRRG